MSTLDPDNAVLRAVANTLQEMADSNTNYDVDVEFIGPDLTSQCEITIKIVYLLP